MTSERFQFADASRRIRAELSDTEQGLRLRLFDEDGSLVVEFESPSTGLPVALDIVGIVSSIKAVRMAREDEEPFGMETRGN